MKTAICCCGYNNPDYLYIALDNIFRLHGIEKYKVYVFIDNNMDENTNSRYKDVFEQYPLEYATISHKHIGDLANTFYPIDYCFRQGHDSVLYTEHDFHILPNTLEWAELIDDSNDFSANLYRGVKTPHPNYFDIVGWRIRKDNFYELWEWIKAKKYIGLPDPRAEGKYFDDTEAVDGKIFAFFIENKKTMFFSIETEHGGSFGINGVNYDYGENKDIAQDWNSRFFTGESSQWIFNMASILYKREYPEILNFKLFPRGSRLYLDLPNTFHYWKR